MMRSYDDADILRHADHSVLIHEAPRQSNSSKSGTLPRPKVGFICFGAKLLYNSLCLYVDTFDNIDYYLHDLRFICVT